MVGQQCFRKVFLEKTEVSLGILGTCTMGWLGEGGKCIHLESLAFQLCFMLLLGSPAPK